MKLLAIGVCFLSFWLAALFEAAGSQGVGLLGARPHLVLLASLTIALVSRPGVGALTGLVGGIIWAGMTGSNMLALCLVGTLFGFLFGWIGQSDIELNVPLGALGIALGTLASQVILGLVAPPPDIGGYLRATILSAVYNGVLAVPYYALLRRLFLDKEI